MDDGAKKNGVVAVAGGARWGYFLLLLIVPSLIGGIWMGFSEESWVGEVGVIGQIGIAVVCGFGCAWIWSKNLFSDQLTRWVFVVGVGGVLAVLSFLISFGGCCATWRVGGFFVPW